MEAVTFGGKTATIMALNKQTGVVIWKCTFHGSVLYAKDGHCVRGENGEVLLVRATPEAYRTLCLDVCAK